MYDKNVFSIWFLSNITLFNLKVIYTDLEEMIKELQMQMKKEIDNLKEETGIAVLTSLLTVIWLSI